MATALARHPAAGYVSRLAAPRARRPRPAGDGWDGGQPAPPGGFSYGTQLFGGPMRVDSFGARPAPSPRQLVEQCIALIYAMMIRNREAVSRVPVRLYADGSRAQGGRPRSACDPIRVSRHVGVQIARANARVSAAAVDQIYEVRNHPILDVLDNPDGMGYFSRKKLIGLICCYMDIVGQAFLVPEGNGWDWRDRENARKKGPPERIWLIYPQYAIPFREAGSPMIRAFQYFRDYIPLDAILWFRHSYSLRDAYGGGYSPAYAGTLYAEQEQRFIAILDQLLGLGPRPNLIVSAADPTQSPGEAERKRFEQDLNRRHAQGNAGNALVTAGAWNITPVSYSPTDLAGMTVSEYDRNNLACIFGQPPTFYTTDTNIANLTAAREQHATMGVEPRCDTIAEALTRLVQTWDPRLFMKFDPVLPEDDEKRAKIIDMKLKNGSLTINQANEEERWPAVPWGDEPWLPGTLVQPSMAVEKHELGLETARAGIEQGRASMDLQKQQAEWEMSPPDETGDEVDAEERALIERERWLLGQISRRLVS